MAWIAMAILWAISLETILTLQWMEMQSFIHNLGDLLDILGGYLVVQVFHSRRRDSPARDKNVSRGFHHPGRLHA